MWHELTLREEFHEAVWEIRVHHVSTQRKHRVHGLNEPFVIRGICTNTIGNHTILYLKPTQENLTGDIKNTGFSICTLVLKGYFSANSDTFPTKSAVA